MEQVPLCLVPLSYVVEERERIYIYPDVPTSECFKYNKSSNEWKWLASMKSNRSYSSSVPINGTLFVTGGVDGDGQNLDSTELISYNGIVLHDAMNIVCQAGLT